MTNEEYFDIHRGDTPLRMLDNLLEVCGIWRNDAVSRKDAAWRRNDDEVTYWDGEIKAMIARAFWLASQLSEILADVSPCRPLTIEDFTPEKLDQARDKDLLADGDESSIFAEDAVALREAAQLLNMDADLRDQYECAIQANTKLANAKKTTLEELAEKYGLTPDGVDFALDQYQTVICEITHSRMSKLSYYARDILSVANDVQCYGCELKEPQKPIKASIKDSDGGTTHWYVCGFCQAPIQPGDNYCHECGKAVKWDD